MPSLTSAAATRECTLLALAHAHKMIRWGFVGKRRRETATLHRSGFSSNRTAGGVDFVTHHRFPIPPSSPLPRRVQQRLIVALVLVECANGAGRPRDGSVGRYYRTTKASKGGGCPFNSLCLLQQLLLLGEAALVAFLAQHQIQRTDVRKPTVGGRGDDRRLRRRGAICCCCCFCCCCCGRSGDSTAGRRPARGSRLEADGKGQLTRTRLRCSSPSHTKRRPRELQ